MNYNRIEEKTEIPIKGPVFISTVYPVTELDNSVIQIMEPIENAFELAGKEVIKFPMENKYFPAPFSYPYRFSSKGLEMIKNSLRNVKLVDSDSIEVKTFPNIPKDEQYLFETSQLEKILANENYISFRIKGWDQIDFMKFPTFVVINFDFTKGQIKSFEDYRDCAAFWRKKTEEFNKLENLKKVLGISRQKKKWSFVPIVTFVALNAYRDVNFENRYIFGQSESKAQELFQKEVSLIERSGDLSKYDVSPVNHFGGINVLDISHEYTLFTPWRFYYSITPIFYEGNAFTERASPEELSRILRSVLFINVVLPSSIEQLQLLDEEIKQRFSNLTKERQNFFDIFSPRKINAFHSNLKDLLKSEEEDSRELERMKEVKKGASEIFMYFETSSLGVPLDNPNVKITAEYINAYRKLFHFEKPLNEINDRRKAETFSNELSSLLDAVEKEIKSYKDETRSATELLENRRNLWQNRQNTLLTIIIPAAGAIVFGIFLWVYFYFFQH